MWMGSPCSHPFLSLKMCVCVLWRPEVVLWMAPGPDLAPNPPTRPTHLIILNQDNIRHAPHGAQVRGHVISAIIFCLEHYFPQDYPPPLHSQHFLSLQLNTSARCVPMNAFLKVFSFPLRQQVKTLCFNTSGRRRVFKNTTWGNFCCTLLSLSKWLWEMRLWQAMRHLSAFNVFIPSQWDSPLGEGTYVAQSGILQTLVKG